MFHRTFKISESSSFFIFGARGTGKSTWVKQTFKADEILFIDLLKPDIEDLYSRDPAWLEKQVLSRGPQIKWVVIDEVQRVPKLLNLVHSLIESAQIKFVLTGSSACKLKRGQANLLAGRANVYHLYPLTSWELGEKFDLTSVLAFGSLPKVFSLDSADDKTLYLQSYALTYLREEIQVEQVVRRLDPFRNFLEIAAVMNGCIINASRIARDVGCDIKTVQSYYQILEDTWLGFHLPVYHTSARKSLKQHPKFYLFDLGVKRALERSLDLTLMPGTSAFGEAFECWVILEAFRLNEYLQRNYKFSYLETHQGGEIDLVLSKPGRAPIVIEIKSSEKIDEIEVNKLARLGKDIRAEKLFYLSRYHEKIQHAGVVCCPWQQGLDEIFGVTPY